MRIGIFSDTHANLEALNAIIGELEGAGVDQLVCLGDSVGYGAEPNEVCDIIRKKTVHTILGNHDAAVAGRMDYSYYYDAARHALDFHKSVLSPPNMTWLTELPYEVREGHISYCHGSPINIEEFEYIFMPEQAARCLPEWARLADVTFIGHSHLCKSFALEPSDVYEVVSQDFEIRPGMKYIVSVGSVGQPRDFDSRASCVIYDSEKRHVEFHRVGYDIDRAAQKIYSANLDKEFGQRLFAGR